MSASHLPMSFIHSGREASTANARKIVEIVDALRGLGVDEKDIQTRAVSIQRIRELSERNQADKKNGRL